MVGAYLARRQDIELVIVAVYEYAEAWVFVYNSKRYLDSGRARDSLAGNGPILVDRRDASMHRAGSRRSVEEYLELYLQGDPAGEWSQLRS
jgi:hypothetical protein